MAWDERVEGHSSFKILYASLRPVFVWNFFIERSFFVWIVCLSAAHILLLICVIEWLVLISISFFSNRAYSLFSLLIAKG